MGLLFLRTHLHGENNSPQSALYTDHNCNTIMHFIEMKYHSFIHSFLDVLLLKTKLTTAMIIFKYMYYNFQVHVLMLQAKFKSSLAFFGLECFFILLRI